MPNTFTSSTDGKQYHYVSSIAWSSVIAPTIVDFATSDKKGRAIGMTRYIKREIVTLEEGAHNDDVCRLHPVGEPLDIFIGIAHTTRNGDIFGSSDIRVKGTDLEKVSAELDKRIERARRLAVKKFATEPDAAEDLLDNFNYVGSRHHY